MTDGNSLEICAGVVLVRDGAALLIRTRRERFELPKGHVEAGESLAAAALRELCEETGLASLVEISAEVDCLEYSLERDGHSIRKRVHYFTAFTVGPQFGPRPRRTHELRWVTASELETTPLVSEALRPLIARVLESRPSDPAR